MAVGGGKAFDGAARHQKILQDSVFNRGHPAGPDPFIIKAVGPDQVSASVFPYGRIEIDGEKIGKHSLANHLLECLRFVLIFLPVPFHAMTEHFVEENTRCPPRENCRTCVRIRHRSDFQRPEIGNHLFHGFEHGSIVGEAFGSKREKGLVAGEFHAIVGLGGGGDEEPVISPRCLDRRAFAGDEPAGLTAGGEPGIGVIDVAIGLERSRIPAHFLFP